MMGIVKPRIRTLVRNFAEVREAFERIQINLDALRGPPGPPGPPGEPPPPTILDFRWDVVTGQPQDFGEFGFAYTVKVGQMFLLPGDALDPVWLPASTESNRGKMILIKMGYGDPKSKIMVDPRVPDQFVDGFESITFFRSGSRALKAITLVSAFDGGFSEENGPYTGWFPYSDRDWPRA